MCSWFWPWFSRCISCGGLFRWPPLNEQNRSVVSCAHNGGV
jgi:hypothetical protein